MGLMEDTGMPVNLTFAAKAYDDNSILRYGYAFEMATKKRVTLPLSEIHCDQFVQSTNIFIRSNSQCSQFSSNPSVLQSIHHNIHVLCAVHKTYPTQEEKED